MGRGEDLLDFLCAGELGQDAGAFDGVGTLNLKTTLPGFWRGVVAWAVAGAEVDDCDFEHFGGVAGKMVEKLTLGSICNRGLL